MGLHTIDTVRRDAAQNRLWFETDMDAVEGRVRVTLTCQEAKLVYAINTEKDVIESISFFGQDGVEGELRFSYLQEIGEVGGEFAAPRPVGLRRTAWSRLEGLWLEKLGDERW